MAPRLSRDTKRLTVADPEVWFRVVHVNMQDNEAFQEQTVEVTLGPKGAFEEGNIGIIRQRVATGGVVNAMKLQVPYRPQKIPRMPRVAELLRKAMEWRCLQDSGEVSTLSEIAFREGLSRARVTQIMSLLRLSPDIRNYILLMPRVTKRPVVTERSLRPIVKIFDTRKQIEAFSSMLIAVK